MVLAGANFLLTKLREFAPGYDYGALFGVFERGGVGVCGVGLVFLVYCTKFSPNDISRLFGVPLL